MNPTRKLVQEIEISEPLFTDVSALRPAMLDELPISDAALHTAQGNANEYDSRVLAFSPNFGRIFSTAESARQMQFGMKVIF